MINYEAFRFTAGDRRDKVIGLKKCLNLNKTLVKITHYIGLFLIGSNIWANDFPETVSAEQAIAFTGVNLVTMLDQSALVDQTLLVKNGRIIQIGKRSEVSIDNEYQVINAEGLYLSPGLADMHTHLAGEVTIAGGIGEKQVMVYLANGVTTILNMGDFLNPFGNALMSLRDRIKTNQLPGPTIYSASFARGAADGGAPGQVLQGFDDGVNHVRQSAQAGYDFIKLYNATPAAAVNGILAEAKVQNMPILGHFPNSLPVSELFENGLDMAAHSAAYYWRFFNFQNKPELIGNAINMTLDNDVYVNTTLKIEETIASIWGGNLIKFDEFISQPEMRYTHPLEIQVWRDGATGNRWNPAGSLPGGIDSGRDFVRLYVKRFFDAGVKFVMGTDSPTVLGAPGFSAHHELDSIKRLGLSDYQTLSTATVNAGHFIRQHLPEAERFGVIAVGARADLILTENNPLTDVAVLRNRLGVMARGNWYSNQFLQAEIEKIATSYENLSNPPITSPPTTDSSRSGGGSIAYLLLFTLGIMRFRIPLEKPRYGHSC